jgi:hypothetical protein
MQTKIQLPQTTWKEFLNAAILCGQYWLTERWKWNPLQSPWYLRTVLNNDAYETHLMFSLYSHKCCWLKIPSSSTSVMHSTFILMTLFFSMRWCHTSPYMNPVQLSANPCSSVKITIPLSATPVPSQCMQQNILSFMIVLNCIKLVTHEQKGSKNSPNLSCWNTL